MPTTQTDSLRAEIRAEMARQNLTNGALATATGRHPQTVGSILSGKSPLSMDYAIAVCTHLGVPLDVMIRRSQETAA